MPRRRRSGRPLVRASGRSRRDLTRDRVIAAALSLTDAKGPASISMRALAATLGVSPMALYNHFSSKRDLLSAAADQVVSGAAFDGHHQGWREQVRHCFDVLRRVCLRHPGLPALLEIHGVAPSSVFAPMAVTLRALGQAGLDPVDSLRTYFLLVSFTLAQAAYQTRGPIAGLDVSERLRTERILSRGQKVTAPQRLPPSWDFDASFAFGIALILNGVEATVATRAVPGSSGATKRPRPRCR